VGGRHDAGLSVRYEAAPVRLAPGARAEIVLTVGSAARTPVDVQAQLIGPWHTYELFPVWNTGVTVPPGGEGEVRFDVVAPPGARPGRWWATVKLAGAGWLHYTETIEVEVLP
jgi:hypothetical protein